MDMSWAEPMCPNDPRRHTPPATPNAAPRRVLLSEPNSLTGTRLLLVPRVTLDTLAGWGWELVTVGRIPA